MSLNLKSVFDVAIILLTFSFLMNFS